MLLNIFVPKANHTFTCDVESLPRESLEYVIRYGATQAVVDTTAGVKRTDFDDEAEFNAAALAKAQKRWDQIVSGNVPGQRGPADPNLAKARELARLMADDDELREIIERAMAERTERKAA